jgi:FtsP/CotA-like multicopper oxidase with cupredoxin domain
MAKLLGRVLTAAVCAGVLFCSASAWADDCARPSSGSEVLPPPDLFSSNGKLTVDLHYKTVKTLTSLNLCFQTVDGLESPTLHVQPGDVVTINLTDDLPSAPAGPSGIVSNDATVCGATTMNVSSVNIHFHGLNLAPKCHGDEVVHTLVNSAQTFTYKMQIPRNEPPGLYWYHPHVHGISSAAVQHGASGAIIVEGIEKLQPAVAGLPQRVLVIRDQLLPGGDPSQLVPSKGTRKAHQKPDSPPQPNWDVSVNYVPILYPDYVPSIIRMSAGAREFWRVVNAGANTVLDVQVVYDGKPQRMQVAALDGVPTGSQNGTSQGTLYTDTHILLPPAGRVEFIVNGPTAGVASAQLVTRAIDGGPDSDSNPARPLAQIQLSGSAPHLARIPQRTGPPNKQRFADLENAHVTATRSLYFSERPAAAKFGPEVVMDFFITVDGQTETLFDPNNPPAITTTKGSVEDWTIENRTAEVHEFHMHQIHFLLLKVSGKRVPPKQRQFLDTVQVPYWTGSGPYPSVKVRMDFRGAVVGDFVYHCHILEHEDGGMMAIIRLLPPGARQKHPAHIST